MSVPDFSSYLYAQTFRVLKPKLVQPGLLNNFYQAILGVIATSLNANSFIQLYTSTMVCFIPKYFVALSSPGNHDVYNLQAPSDEEKQNWIKYFKVVIKNLKSTDQTQILFFICTINFLGYTCVFGKFIAKHSQLASYCTMT